MTTKCDTDRTAGTDNEQGKRECQESSLILSFHRSRERERKKARRKKADNDPLLRLVVC